MSVNRALSILAIAAEMSNELGEGYSGLLSASQLETLTSMQS